MKLTLPRDYHRLERLYRIAEKGGDSYFDFKGKRILTKYGRFLVNILKMELEEWKNK